MSVEPSKLLQHFRALPLFASLPDAVLPTLAERCKIHTLEQEQVVFRKNDPGASMFLILEGGVVIHEGAFHIQHLGPDAHFGELSLLDAGKRSLTVTCTQPTVLAEIDRDLFFHVLSAYPAVVQRIVGILTERLRVQTDTVIRQLHSREQELTELVEARTEELYQRMMEVEAEKKEAEYQRARAEQSERLEQEFLANMSHEIRTPMNAVLGMTNMLLRNSPRPDQVEHLQSIQNASESLLVILNDILDISKIQAGRLELEQTPFSPAEIVQNVCRTLRFLAENKGIALTVDLDPHLPEVVVGDPTRLQQVLMNLTGNGIKFTQQGSVQIAAHLVRKEGSTAEIRFEVTDTGIGMSEEALKYIFEPFRQAKVDTTRQFGGTGLGLSIARQLVDLFGGKLRATSVENMGSMFFFNIPFEKSHPSRLKKPPVNPALSLQQWPGLNVLLAEDNAYNQVVACDTLRYLLPGVTITTASDGKEAREWLERVPFDVVLMDVAMPEANGMEVTRWLRSSDSPNRNTPVIACTAYAASREQKQCLDAGMNLCITKPYREADMAMGLLKVLHPEQRNDTPLPTPPSLDSEFPFLFELTRGDGKKIEKYLKLYLESAQKTLKVLEEAIFPDNLDTVRKVVHTIKPQLAMIDMNDAGHLASLIERAIMEQRTDEELHLWIEQLTRDIQASIQRLNDRNAQ